MALQIPIDNESMLAVLVYLLNEPDEEGNFILNKPFRHQDFDRLTSDEMVKILVMITREIIPELQNTTKSTGTLTQFREFGLGKVTYDKEIDIVYHAIRKLFKNDSPVPLHYSTLLLPAQNPKLTKEVLASVMKFYTMCDAYYEKFKLEFDTAIRVAGDKAKLYNEIEDLNLEVDEIIQKRMTEQNRLPLLENESRTLQESIRKEQIILSNVNEEVSKLKGEYMLKESEVHTLKEQLEQLKAEKLSMEAQLVQYPSELVNKCAALKHQLKVETAQRDKYSSTNSVISQKHDEYEKLILEATRIRQELQNAVPFLEKVKSDKQQLADSSIAGNASGELTNLKMELEQLIQQYEALVREKLLKEELYRKKNRNLVKETKSYEKQCMQNRAEIRRERKQLQTIKSQVGEIGRMITAIRNKISQCIGVSEVEIPLWRLELERLTKQALEEFIEAFGDFQWP